LVPLAWIAVVVAVQWWPLEFRGDPEFLRERVTAMTTPSYALTGMSWNLFLGLSLAFVLAMAWPSGLNYRFRRIRLAALAAVACSTVAAIEFGQLFIPARHPHPSHAVVGAIGVILGLHIERIMMRSSG
jgi:VanZ family protein